MHTDEPGQVFEKLSAQGELRQQKVEDMARQQEASRRSATQQVAICTDTGCDLPEELLDELNVHVIPHRIMFGKSSYIAKLLNFSAATFRTSWA
jgi:hypothetical protein